MQWWKEAECVQFKVQITHSRVTLKLSKNQLFSFFLSLYLVNHHIIIISKTAKCYN